MVVSAGASHLTCTICEPGTFCFQDNTTQCPAHSNSSYGAATIAECVCLVGYYDVNNECLACPTGYYCLEGTEATTACPDNSDSPEYSSRLADCLCVPGYTGNSGVGCVACPAGAYKTLAGPSTCTPCAQNTYSTLSARASACDACPVNTVSPAGSDEAVDCVSAPGFYDNGGGVQPCPGGSFQELPGQNACELCAVGKFSTATAAATAATCMPCPQNSSSLAGSSSVSACTCNSGYEGVDGGPCVACVAGTFKATTGDASCQSCAADTYSSAAATSCVACGADSSATVGSGACLCKAGYTTAGSDCTGCDPGTFKSSVGNETCQQCAAGSFSVAGGSACDPCPVDTYQDITGSVLCKSCQANSVAAGGSTDVSACQCNPGFGFHAGECVQCPYGSYKTSTGNSVCVACAAGWYTSTLGATSAAQCFECGFDSFVQNGQCVACPLDSEAPSASTSQDACMCSPGFTGLYQGIDCTQCAVGFFKSSSGSSACEACPPGHIGNADTPRTSTDSCEACPVDTYEEDHVQCQLCTPNSESPTASTSWTNCTCKSGYQGNYLGCEGCALGLYKNGTGAGSCVFCPRGKFSNTPAATSLEACIDCHAHSTQFMPPPYTSSAECACEAGYEPVLGVCEACQPGFWKDGGDFPCLPCAANTYYPDTSPAPYTEFLCLSCPGNSTAESGSFGVAACVCLQGFLRTQASCALCSPGGYCPNQTTYMSCPVHKNSPAGSFSVEGCTCDPGYYGPAGSQDCAYCPANAYCAGGDSLVSCPANSSTVTRTRQTNITACKCNPGFYEVSDGTCMECPVDSYCNREIKLACPANSSSVSRSDSIDECLCDEGFRKAGTGCEPCPPDVLCLGGGVEPQQCAADALVVDLACVCAAGMFCADVSDSGCFTACDTCPIDSWCASNAMHACASGKEASAGSDEISDCICIAGTYEEDDVCPVCPTSHYCHGGHKFPCTEFDPRLITVTTGNSELGHCKCDFGFFRLYPHDMCKVCPFNFYCPYEDGFMLPNVVACGENEHTRFEMSTQSSECICDAGFALSETGDTMKCTACEPGQRCQNGFVVEFMCQTMNRVPNEYHTKCVCLPSYGEYELECQLCMAGSIKPTAGDFPCHYCPMNTFWMNTTYCAPCPPHSQSDPGSLSCTCDAPFVMQDGQCVVCEDDMFYEGGACVECPQNSSSVAGAPSISACACDPGHFRVQNSNGTQCLRCPVNTFEQSGQCLSCGRNATSPEASADAAACTCNASQCLLAVWGWDCEGVCEAPPPPCSECMPGYFKDHQSPIGNTAQCSPCGVATYQPDNGASSCLACASTEFHYKTAQTNVSSCECVAGYEPTDNASTPCRKCAKGFFKSERGDWPCTPCAVGSFADEEGSLTCTECAVASVTAPRRGANTTLHLNSTSFAECTCLAGYFLVNYSTHTQCTPCVPGSFKTIKGTHECSFCGALQPHVGTSYEHYHGSAEAGAVSDAHCSPCPAFSGQDAALVGLEGVILDDWTDCLCFGGHENLTRAGCQSCAEYKFRIGYSREACAYCANGSYYTTRFQSCVVCELREFGSATELHVGYAINRLDTELQWGVDERDCSCKLGYERVADACQQCPLGQFRGSRAARYCSNCDSDMYTNSTGSLECAACPAHSTTLGRNATGAVTGCICDAGFQWNADTLECDACAPGTFRSEEDVRAETLVCVTCPADHYSLAQADACTPCPAHERAGAGAPSLDHCNCMPGYGDDGAGACALCPNATFSAGGDEDGNRHPACVDCPAQRNSTRGSTVVEECLCVPGYGAGPGACVPCPDGFYSLGGHNTSCSSCGWGAISEPPLAATNFDACLCNAAIGVYEA